MIHRITAFLAAAMLVLAMAPTDSPAYQSGIYDQARPATGCNCHGGSEPTPSVVVLVTMDGEPISQVAGFVPGKDYAISIWVLGQTPLLAGFNLEFTGGSLAPVDGTLDLTGERQSQVRALTECGYVKVRTAPVCFVDGNPGKQCGIVDDPQCSIYDIRNPACQRCTSIGEGCRACDDTTNIDVQATHSDSALPATKGKLMPNWDFVWTAPDDPSIDSVTVYAAGNDVAGEGNTAGDFWNYMLPENGVVLPRL